MVNSNKFTLLKELVN